jgi:hypothetical protein
MATRYDKSRVLPDVVPSGYEGEATREMSIPPCGIEDVDRAFYDLFNEKLPLFYKKSKESGEQTRIPVIFASGERFALVSKKEPFRDRNGALILPLISITRSGVEQDSTRQGGVSDRFNEMIIRKRVSPEDPLYQNLVNSKNFTNSEFASAGNGSPETFEMKTGRLLDTKLGQNVYEVFVIPMPKYFTLKYEVTIWCQYTQQANDVITSILGSYVQPGNRTIRIDTKKGYWFVAYFEPTVGQDTNASDFSDSERIIKVTLSAEVPGYLILPDFPGSSNGVRSFVSAPSISFVSAGEETFEDHTLSIGSGYADAYILDDIELEGTPKAPGQIGISGFDIAAAKAGARRPGVRLAKPDGSDSGQGATSTPALSGPGSKSGGATLGKTSSVKSQERTVTLDVNPYTGKKQKTVLRVTDSVPSKGEEILTIDILETIRRG